MRLPGQVTKLTPLVKPLALILAGVWLFFGGLLGQWLGVALMLTALSTLGSLARKHLPETCTERVGRYFYPVSLITLMGTTYHKLLMGKMPWIADHSVHQSKAYMLWEKLISHGHITGWTHFAGPGGHPAETLYPPFVDLYLVFFRAITFGLLSWESTYAFAFFIFLLFNVMVFYYVGSRLAGRTAGFIAALFAVVDVGAFRQGGWVFTVRWGVWPLTFAMALTLLTITFLSDWLKKERSPKWAMITGALALLTHPMALLIIVPVTFAMVWFSYAQGERPLPTIKKALLYLCMVCGLSAWWLIPFFHYGTDYAAHVSALSGTINNVSAGLSSPSPWGSAWSWAAALGLLGIIELWREGRSALALAMITTSAGALIVGSSTFLAGLGLFDLMPTLRHVQFPRFLIFVKATFFLAAGVTLSRIILHTPESAPTTRRWAVRGVGIAIIAALLLPMVQHLYARKIEPLTDYPTDPKIKRGLHNVARRLTKEAANTQSFFRVALAGNFAEHRHTGLPILTGLPFVKLTFVPSDTYKYRSKVTPSQVPRSAAELKLMNIAYVVSIGPAHLPNCTLLTSNNGVYLYKFNDYSPKRVYCDGCDATIHSFKDRRVSLTVAGLPEGGGWVRLPVSPFPRWRAYNNGNPVKLLPWKASPRITYMGVFVRNGTLTLRYERRWPDWLGDLISLFLILLIAIPGRFTYPHLKRLSRWRRRHLKRLRARLALRKSVAARPRLVQGLWVVLILAGLALLYVVRSWEPGHKAFPFSRAKVTITLNGTPHFCPWFFPQRYLCGEGLAYVGLEARLIQGEAMSGIFLHPEGGKPLAISWDKVTLGSRVVITAAIDDAAHPTKGLPVTITLLADNRPLGTVTLSKKGTLQRTAIDTSALKGKSARLTFTFVSKHKGTTNTLFKPSIE